MVHCHFSATSQTNLLRTSNRLFWANLSHCINACFALQIQCRAYKSIYFCFKLLQYIWRHSLPIISFDLILLKELCDYICNWDCICAIMWAVAFSTFINAMLQLIWIWVHCPRRLAIKFNFCLAAVFAMSNMLFF